VASQGCPHCAARAIVAWGRSHGLSRFRCKSCGRTFNALTKTAMAHPHKRERWFDHARAMIEGKSLTKTAELCGVHPTTAFRWRHRFLGAPAADKPRRLSGIVEADETFILESFKGRWSAVPRKRGGQARHPGFHSDNIPVLVARDRRGATFDAVLPQDDSASIGAALAGVVTSDNHLIGDGGKAIAAFARKAQSPFTAHAHAGQAHRRGASPPHHNVNAYHGHLKQWLNRFNGVATKNLPNYLGWRRALEPGATRPRRTTAPRAQSETAHINRYRYKSLKILPVFQILCYISFRLPDAACGVERRERGDDSLKAFRIGPHVASQIFLFESLVTH
jgi:transposase-like protein